MDERRHQGAEANGRSIEMDDDRSKKKKEYDDGDEPDVELHRYIPDDLGTDDPEKKRGKKRVDEVGDDDFGKKKK
jgi:hypothetical protein